MPFPVFCAGVALPPDPPLVPACPGIVPLTPGVPGVPVKLMFVMLQSFHMRVRFHQRGGGLDLRETFHGPVVNVRSLTTGPVPNMISGGLGADRTFCGLKKFFWRHV